MVIPIDEVVYADVVCHDPSTGSVSDADSAPTFAVYEEATDTAIVTGTSTKRTSLTGNYRMTFTASAANGFEAGKWYSVIASATVNSLSGKTVAMSFRCVAAETTAGVPVVSVNGVTFPANFSALGINASGHVSRVTLVDTTTANTDMLTAAGVWSLGTRTITGGTIGTYTGNTPQTGDAFARLGAPVGASISADLSGIGSQVNTVDDLLDTEMPALTVAVAAVKAKTDLIPAAPAAVGDLSSLATAAAVAGVLTEVQKVPRTGTTHTHTNTGTAATATVAIT